VPPAAIDEHSKAASRQHDVGRAPVSQLTVKTKPHTPRMKSTTKQQFRLGIDLATSGKVAT